MIDYREDTSLSGRKAEIDAKVLRLTAKMKQQNLAAVYIAKSNNYAWITAGGDNIITRYSEVGVIGILITRQGARFALSNTIEKPRILEEEQLTELGFALRFSEWFENRTLAFIREIIGENTCFGADLAMGDAKNAEELIAQCQYSLLPNETARYLHLGKTFSAALEGALAKVRPGDTELSVVGKINEALWPHNMDAVLYLVAADERIAKFRHCIPTEKKIEKMFMVSCNGRYKGLVTKTTRFVSFGKPSEAFLKQYEDTAEIENRMALATKAGVDNLEILHLAQSLYAQKGWPEMWRVHHQGGPQGYTNGYYLITEQTHGIVEENSCYCYNPSITGTKTEDAFLVTEAGPLFITGPVTFPKLVSTIDGVTFERPGVLVLDKS